MTDAVKMANAIADIIDCYVSGPQFMGERLKIQHRMDQLTAANLILAALGQAGEHVDRKQKMDALWKVLREYRLEDGQTVVELIKSGHDRISILAGLVDASGENLPTLNAREAEPAAWTGSGSMAALKDGREGFIWPSKGDAHPIPLYARPPGEVIALQLDRKVGMKGCAYDPPGPCRAYTYEHQPTNLPAYSLGRAHAAAAAMSAGDNIDRGLGLLKALEEQGFGVFEIEQGGARHD